MPHQVTVTGQTGPARAITSAVIPNVTGVTLLLNDKRLAISTDPSTGVNVKEFDLALTTTMTVSIAAGNYSIVVS